VAEREETVSTAELARCFGVDERTIRNWVAIGCPQRMRSKRPAYVLSEVIAWRRRQDKTETSAGDKPDLALEQARKLRADADLAELKVMERRRELVPSADVERQMERLCGILRSRVLGLRGRWAPRVLGLGTMADATRILDDLANDMLEALRSSGDELEADDPPEDDGASPEEDAA
jgi:phage terminase Nu1 subunit (DNA packaging protein)